MGYKMKGFSGFGNSPAKQKNKKEEYPTKEDKKFLKEQREESVHAMDYLTKIPTGPRAKVKNVDLDKELTEHNMWHVDDEKDHAIFTNITEGSRESQELRRKENEKKKKKKKK